MELINDSLRGFVQVNTGVTDRSPRNARIAGNGADRCLPAFLKYPYIFADRRNSIACSRYSRRLRKIPEQDAPYSRWKNDLSSHEREYGYQSILPRLRTGEILPMPHGYRRDRFPAYRGSSQIFHPAFRRRYFEFFRAGKSKHYPLSPKALRNPAP